MSNYLFNDFPDKRMLADRLAVDIGDILSAGIRQNGSAILAVSGGSTPKLLFPALSRLKLEWDKILVTLVDERWVDEASERSNARAVKTCLMQDKAASAKFIPMFQEGMTLTSAIGAIENTFQKLRKPFDVIILGMGTDGHTASLFPFADNLAGAVDLSNEKMVSVIYSDAVEEPRITLNLPVLLGARFLALHLEGSTKLDVLKQAQGPGDANAMPVRYVLNNAKHLQIYYCP